MTESLEQVLADETEDIAVLRRLGHGDEADIRSRVVERVRAASEDFISWLTEREAMLWSGKKGDWFRSHRPAWERDGHARRSEHNARTWLYRRCVLPRGASIDAARADAERAARGESGENSSEHVA